MSVDLDKLASEKQRAEVKRLHGKRWSRASIARRVGLSEWRLRKVLEAMGLTGRHSYVWTSDRPDLRPDQEGAVGPYTANDYLRDHAGEMGVRRMAREIGVSRSAVQVRLCRLGLRVNDLRTDLTAEVVGQLLGRSAVWVRLNVPKGRTVCGVLRWWPSELRQWVVADVTRVDWSRVAREDLLDIAGLIAGEWGVSDDAVKDAKAKAKGAA